MISIIVAMDERGCIGVNDALPWHLSRDIKHFKDETKGKTVVMGRKTWESIPEKYRPLPGRRNIVLTRTVGYIAAGAEVFTSIEGVGDIEEDLFVIGGGEIYSQFVDKADQMLVTHVDTIVDSCEGVYLGVYFESIDESSWDVSEMFSQESDDRNEYSFTVRKYKRKENE